MSWGRFGVVLAIAMTMGCKKSPPPPEGRDLFASVCARCHGADGSGGLPLFEGGPSPRNFRDHAFHTSHSDAELAQTIRNGKGAGMPPFGATFNDAQIAALVAQIRSFDPENR
jgi:cytochrome c oxidase cbb3-type subunit III